MNIYRFNSESSDITPSIKETSKQIGGVNFSSTEETEIGDQGEETKFVGHSFSVKNLAAEDLSEALNEHIKSWGPNSWMSVLDESSNQ